MNQMQRKLVEFLAAAGDIVFMTSHPLDNAIFMFPLWAMSQTTATPLPLGLPQPLCPSVTNARSCSDYNI